MVAIGKAKHNRSRRQNWSERYRRDFVTYSQSVTFIPRGYEPLEKLRHGKHVIKLLRHIEARSKQRAGETKWYTQEMADLIGKSVRSVYYYLKLLRTHGYISVLTDVRQNRLKNNPNKCFCIRVIRCNRIIRARAGKVQRGKLFRVDIRPPVNATGYLPGTPVEWKQRDPNTWYDLIRSDDYDKTVDDIQREFRDRLEEGDMSALKFLGTNFKVDLKGYAIQ